jgi:hypothetical protein
LQQLLSQLGDIALQQRAQPVGVVVQLVDLLLVLLFAGADFGGGEAVVFAGAGGVLAAAAAAALFLAWFRWLAGPSSSP